MPRAIFSDGLNSASHVLCGWYGQSSFLVPFLGYQIGQGRPNDLVDIAEYLSGWIARKMFAETSYPGQGLGQAEWLGPLSVLFGPSQGIAPKNDPVLMQQIQAGGATTPGGITIVPGTCFGSCYVDSGDESACLNQCTSVTSSQGPTQSGFNPMGGSLNPFNPLNSLPAWWPFAAIALVAFFMRK